MWNRFESGITEKLDTKQKKMWDILIFLARFMALAIPFHLILWTNFDAISLQVLTAKSVSFLLSAFMIPHSNIDIYLAVPIGNATWTIEIIKDCVGWKSFLAVCGLIFAMRGVSAKARLAGILLALPLIYLGNIIRIFSSIYLTLIFGYESFDIIHGILWQGGMIALILAIWLFWLDNIAGIKNTNIRKRQ